MEKHFLEQYKTQDKPEAKKAAERKERITGEKGIFQDRSERIRAYIERLENVFLNPDLKVRERNIEILKPTIYENTLIKRENFPDTYFEFHKQQLVDRGIPKEQVEKNFDVEKKEQKINRVIESQKMSLDNWIDYLTGADCKYPADIKYFAIQGVLKLGTFDTQKYLFTKRMQSTTAPFAEIDREALSIVLGAVEAKNYNKPIETYSKELLTLINKGNSFGDMYAFTMRELDQKAEKSDLLPVVEGEWKVFEKGSNPQVLVDALVGKRSNLCLADIGSATTYLNQGAVEVYFSYNRIKQPIVPRIAIAYNEEKGGVYEVRGTYNKNEDTDPYIEESGVLMKRLQNLPNGESFAKKDTDMKRVTELYKKCFSVDRKTGEKTYLNPKLSKEELTFLYEIDNPIDGFGYQKDPRIRELRDKRKPSEDVPIVFDCRPENIAWKKEDVNENTKAYIGPLFEGIFQKNFEYLYTSFPEEKIQKYEVEIGGKTKDTLKKEIKEKGFFLSSYAESMMDNPDFSVSKNIEKINTVRLKVSDLGFTSGNPTTDGIYKKAEKLGLELCPAETGPHLCLKWTNQPLNDYLWIAMKQINGSARRPSGFGVRRVGGGEAWLSSDFARPAGRWGLGREFLFRFRKSS